jgi:hypothetical protein
MEKPMRLGRNRIVSTLAIICAGGAIVAGSTLAAPAPAAGPRIFSVWQGDGSIVKVGNDAAGIIGTFGGMAFAVTDDVPSDIGTITCPGIFQLDFKQGTVTGTGGCVFNANDGAQAYGTFDCKGTGEGECTGRFQINGGSGRLASVKGESGFVLRTRMMQIAREPNFVIYETAMGTATWPGLRILLPAQNAQPNTKK